MTINPSIVTWFLLNNQDVPKDTFREWGRQVEVDLAALRQTLAAPLTFFVRADGNDSNTGLVNSAGGAFLTIQRAINVAAALDTLTHAITISVGAGTFAPFTCLDPVGAGAIVVSGAGASTIVSGVNAHAVLAEGSFKYTLQNMRLTCTGSGSSGLMAFKRSAVNLGAGMSFGACASAQAFAHDSTINFLSNYEVAGGAAAHWWGENNGLISCAGRTITVTGTPAFTYWAVGDFGATLRVNANTFVGSATGSRFYVAKNGTIATNGGGPNYFPGSTVGIVGDASGVYV